MPCICGKSQSRSLSVNMLILMAQINEFPDMRLYETSVKDVEMLCDNFVPGSTGRGVRVLMA